MNTERALSMEAVLRYDPWAFPILVHPRADFSRVLFGWFLYEAFNALCTLCVARKKWKSEVYLAILAATLFASVSGVLAFVSVCSVGTTAADPFAGPSEVGIATSSLVFMQAARIGFFFATTKITLAVFPADVKVKAVVCLVSFLALIGSLIFTVLGIVFQSVLYKQYEIYKETNDAGVVLARIFTDIIPIAEQLKYGAVTQTSTMIIFIVVTNLLFLMKILRTLNIPLLQAIVTGGSSCAAQRIICNVVLTIVEASISLSQDVSDLALMMTWFAVMYEINTLASLAFDHSNQIVKDHSMMHKSSSRTKQGSSSNGEGRRGSVAGEGLQKSVVASPV